MILDDAIKRRIETMLGLLNERQRRLYLAVEVQGLGYGGLRAVSEFTGVSESTIRIGQKELESGGVFDVDRVRKGGWGMFSGEKVEGLKVELENLMEKPVLDSGSGEFVLSWTTKSLLELEGVLEGKGVRVSHAMIGELLGELGYSLRSKRKMLHFGGVRPDRDAQFRYINQRCGEFLARGWPVVSVVSDEKELLFDFRHITLNYCRGVVGGNVDFTFPVEQVAELASLDVFEVNGFLGFVNLGVLPGVVDFGVEGLLRWWRVLGRHVYGDAKRICVVSDGGGRGGVWYRLWRAQLQVFADVSGLEVCVLYLPPGTSRWHTVKHELFCFTNESVDVGVPVVVRVAVKILSNKDWDGVLGVCAKDEGVFNLGLSVSDEDLSLLNLVEDEFNGHWNYTIRPKVT